MITGPHRLRTLALAILLLLLLPIAPRAEASPRCSAARAQAAAQRYIDALTDRKAAWAIPLDRHVVRFENDLLTAATALELRLDLYLHIQLSVFQGVEDIVWTYRPDGRADVVNATYHTPVGLPGLIVAGTVIDEDFTLNHRCQLQVIDATFTVDPPA